MFFSDNFVDNQAHRVNRKDFPDVQRTSLGKDVVFRVIELSFFTRFHKNRSHISLSVLAQIQKWEEDRNDMVKTNDVEEQVFFPFTYRFSLLREKTCLFLRFSLVAGGANELWKEKREGKGKGERSRNKKMLEAGPQFLRTALYKRHVF